MPHDVKARYLERRPAELVVSASARCCSTATCPTPSRSTSTASPTASDTFIAGIMEHIEEAGIHSGDFGLLAAAAQSLEARNDRRARPPDPRACAGAQGRRADERAIRHQGRRHLCAGGQSARLAHRAVRRQGDRPAGRQDRRAHHGGRDAGELRLQASRASTMSASRRRCSRSPVSRRSTPCSARR